MAFVCESARFQRIRALFLSALLISSLFFFLTSCNPATFRAERAELYPLFVHDPGRGGELLSFAALFLAFDSGDTRIAGIELTHTASGVSWNVRLPGTEAAGNRSPFEGEEYQRPDFYSENPGSANSLLYPWFVLPDDSFQGSFTVAIEDLSLERQQLELDFRTLSRVDSRELAERLGGLSPSLIALPGSWELLAVDSSDGTIIARIDYSASNRSELMTADTIPADALWYIWGVPAEYDCMLLSGPYLP